MAADAVRLKVAGLFAAAVVVMFVAGVAVWWGTRTTDEDRAEKVTESALAEMQRLTDAIGFEVVEENTSPPLPPARPFEFSRESNSPQGRNGFVIVRLQGPPGLTDDISLTRAFADAVATAGYQVVDTGCRRGPVGLLLTNPASDTGITAALYRTGETELRMDIGTDYRVLRWDEVGFSPSPGDCWPVE